MKFLKFLVCIIIAASICMVAACTGGGATDGVTDNNTTDVGTTDNGTADEEEDDGSTDESPSGDEEENDGTTDDGDLLDSINEVIDALLDRPDPFSFLPEALSQEKLAYSSVQSVDFSEFVSTSSILTKFTGRQMHVVQGVLSRSSTILSGADTVFAAGEVIAQAYRTFIAENGSGEFSKELAIAGSTFNISISVSETAASLSASNGTISISLKSDTSASAEWRNSGVIELGNTGVLKYGFSEDAISLALKFTLAGVSYMQYLSFESEDGVVSGELTEFIGTESININKTCALIYSDDEITAVISNKKGDSSDMSIDAFAEVYSSVNGQYLAGEVTETALTASYKTIWVPLSSVGGIVSVCVTDEENADNKLNSNSVYINGSSTPLAVEYNSIYIPIYGDKSTSRHYDIELRTVWYYVLGADGEVEECEVQIPMLFVQSENVEDFTKEMQTNNGVNASLPTEAIARVEKFFDEYEAEFEEYKEQITYEWLSEYIESL